MPESILMSVEQTSKILNCSTGTIRNLLKLGKLPHIRFGTSDRVVRIRKDDVLAFIERSQQVAQRSLEHKTNGGSEL